MGRIVVTEFVSLDGVVEAPGGGEDFEHDGWTFEIDRGDEGNRFKLDETMGSEALLLGRTTYEGFAAAWPSRDGEFADKFNSMPKYVVSSTLEEPGVEQHDRPPRATSPRRWRSCARRTTGDVVVHGSAQLVQGLLEDDLVDELRLMVFPVVLGTGKRLFGETSDKKPLAARRARRPSATASRSSSTGRGRMRDPSATVRRVARVVARGEAQEKRVQRLPLVGRERREERVVHLLVDGA